MANKKRLIDADKIYDAVERRYQVSSGIEHGCERDLLDLICAADIVDAVEVVRCRDCKHKGWVQEPCHGRSLDYCRLWECVLDNIDTTFCSYGERKDGND